MPPNWRAGIVPDTAKTEDATKFFDFSFDYHRIRSLSDQDKAAAADTSSNRCAPVCPKDSPSSYEIDRKTSEFFDPKNWTGDIFNVDKVEQRGKKNGGHAVLCVGFDSNRKLFRIINSWGAAWKGKGYFWMPFSWFERSGTAYDLWTIRPDLAPILRDHDPIE